MIPSFPQAFIVYLKSFQLIQHVPNYHFQGTSMCFSFTGFCKASLTACFCLPPSYASPNGTSGNTSGKLSSGKIQSFQQLEKDHRQSTDIEKKLIELMCLQFYFHPSATTCNFFCFKSKIAPNKQKKDVKKSFEYSGKLIWYSIIFSSFRL